MFELRKLKFIIILSVICFFLFAEEGWHVQNPLPSESWYFTVETVGENTVFIGGMGGTLVQSNDAGQTWDVQKFEDLVDIRDISFKDEQTGYFIDGDHLHKTTDGGDTWNEIGTDFDLETYFFNYLCCCDDVIYLILKPRTASVDGLISAQTHLYKSENGGRNWLRIDVTMKGRELCAFFRDKYNGYIYVEEIVSISEAYTCLYQTHDGGNTWTKNTYSDIYFARGIFFLNDNIGFIGKFKTIDGGDTWENVFSEHLEEYENIDGFALVDSLNGWAICSGSIYKTINGGDTWEKVDQYSTHALYDIVFSKEGAGWIAGLGGNIYNMPKNSSDWIKVSKITTNNLKDIYFINENVGWCVGYNGIILHTVDGGDSWIKQECPVDSLLLSVKFLNDQIGWVVGYNIVLYTEDGGETWEVRDDLYGRFVDVDFFDEQVGLIIDYYGKVYKTDNNGESWQSITIPHTLTYLEIINSEKVCIGSVGGLAYSNDRGNSVQWYDLPAILKVREIQFVNEDEGYIRNDGLEIFYTINGGQSWTVLNNTSIRIDAIHMLSNNDGWIFSGRGGGYLGEVEIINHDIEERNLDIYKVAFIEKIYFINDSCGWAIGPGGVILKYGSSNDPTIVADTSRVLVYPNPSVNGNIVNIEFDLSTNQYVQLDLFNIYGQFIRSLIRSNFPTGKNSILLKRVGLPSGVYFITFRANDYFECKKILLLK